MTKQRIHSSIKAHSPQSAFNPEMAFYRDHQSRLRVFFERMTVFGSCRSTGKGNSREAGCFRKARSRLFRGIGFIVIIANTAGCNSCSWTTLNCMRFCHREVMKWVNGLGRVVLLLSMKQVEYLIASRSLSKQLKGGRPISKNTVKN